MNVIKRLYEVSLLSSRVMERSGLTMIWSTHSQMVASYKEDYIIQGSRVCLVYFRFVFTEKD